MILKTVFAAAAVPAAVVMASCALPNQSTGTLKVSSCLTKNHDYTKAFLDTFYTPLNAMKTDINLRYLGGPEVTPRQDQAPALKRGLIDIITCPAGYYGGILSEARMPGMQRRPLRRPLFVSGSGANAPAGDQMANCDSSIIEPIPDSAPFFLSSSR